MRFIADSMLGRLARWLRLLGYDTLYFPEIDDGLLLKISREEERILLTRDTRLAKVKGLKRFLLLDENDPFKQLKRVITTLTLDKEGGISLQLIRCVVCNTPLEKVPKEEARGKVPQYVYNTIEEFKFCSGCKRFYWKGTHPDMARRKLLEVLHDD
ncbi:MAG: Mut7-C RNAse domain-containing protein [Thermodesulfovibrionia bacterium]